jgi:steroid 5-alpha reductase family enzyme
MVTGKSRRAAFAWVFIAYLAAGAAALATGFALSSHSPIVIALAADVAATLVVYVFGRIFRNSSFYDPYWSLAPIAIAVYWTASSGVRVGLLQIAVLLLISVWGLRLTWHWAVGWRGLAHEDWRYTGLRQKTGRTFWLVELLGIDTMTTLVVFLGCLSLYPVLTSAHSFGALDLLAIAVTATAIMIEAVSDHQLEQFISGEHKAGDIMSSGLWSLSRHPNYLGEVAFWWGLYLFALAQGLNNWWAIVGPLTVTALFVFISVPMMDGHMAEKHPAYAERRRSIPALLPRFGKS